MPDLPYARDVMIEMLTASPVHRYEGRPADGPSDPIGREQHGSVEVRAGLGIVGDRYFGHRAHITSSVTVRAAESVEHVASALGVGPLDPALF